ncbi:MAG: peptidase M48 [Candidatus Muproteobacteria bacterium RIFCSPHIGHO2_01_FULL_65_16]|uniref:Peptidase M48 n=1 Tax=Candidatus Muproteobacteria bacterium RIFCSPHIGHO2_01_FULL_65_16 TaxID=1817764 RepID=A0A1F6THC0_9PROT|nr:MAG: peptidase M48 [Candidatus Muproteobacteria bacterium RIFCSPHIGHO2_01_FULL_65_16]
MNTFTFIFLSVLGLTLLTQLWLERRQIGHVRARRGAVPAAFKGRVPLKAHKKAADYAVARAHFTQAGYILDAALLCAWTLGGGLEWLDRFWRGFDLSATPTGAAFMLSAFFVMGVLDIPAAAYQTFMLEGRFGFNRTTPRLFALDLGKKAALLGILGAPVIITALWLMSATGAWWWIHVWLLWLGFSLFVVWAYPALIAPLFNRFTPLKQGPIRRRVRALLARVGFRSRGIYVMDSSRRSLRGNAYFSGFGRSKRIVFFDTLLRTLNVGEIVAVLAHELGHFKRGHVRQRFLLSSGMSLAGLALLGWLISQPWFYTGLGMSRPSAHAALMLFLLVGPVFAFFLQPLLAWAARRHEYEADEFAARAASARDLIGALGKLYKGNASTLTPDPLHSAFYDSHPPAVRRIARLAGRI